MAVKNHRSLTSVSVPTDNRPAPVRLKLRRRSNYSAKAHPPDGNGKVWWEGLKKAMGTSSSAFVDASLIQLQAAARLPGGGVSEIAVNSALALIEAVAPKDEIEGALAIQMACTHTAAMAILARMDGYCRIQSTAICVAAAARLMRAYVAQLEALRRLRHGGSQLVRVEHVHVSEGGQAIIGNVSPAGK
jgi:hypothetical protein